MLKGIGLLMSFALLSASNSGYACSCQQLSDDFFETVAKHTQRISRGHWSEEQNLTIVVGKVLRHQTAEGSRRPTEMVVEVSHVLQGDVPTSRIKVEGDNGAQCRPYVEMFPVGASYTFAISHDDSPDKAFYLSNCGKYWLETRRMAE